MLLGAVFCLAVELRSLPPSHYKHTLGAIPLVRNCSVHGKVTRCDRRFRASHVLPLSHVRTAGVVLMLSHAEFAVINELDTHDVPWSGPSQSHGAVDEQLLDMPLLTIVTAAFDGDTGFYDSQALTWEKLQSTTCDALAPAPDMTT
jgi:hypothetical protein